MIFVTDDITISNQEHPIMCLDLSEQVGKYFRVIPAEIWGVENNLSIANMDFYEFAKSVGPGGIFRGF
ncbi:MAG TPA: hypothetical protein PLO56_11405 [Rhodothermales bacterium]|nr:hypothetical protein [Rhodothermales bacterium]